MEKLNEEQMEMVDGGNSYETAGDSLALYEKGLMSQCYRSGEFFWNWKSLSPQVDEAWKKIGVTCVTGSPGHNEYYYEDRQISRQEALTMLGVNPNEFKYKRGKR